MSVDLLKRPFLLYSYAGAFLLMFSQGILAYMLPLKVEWLGYDSSLSGLLLSAFAIVSTLFFILPTNRVYDKWSNLNTMIAGLLVLSVALLFLDRVEAAPMLYTVMGLYGIGFALIFPSMSAMVATNSTDKERGKAFGLFYGFFSLGVVAGSLITGLLIDAFSPFLVGAITLFASSSLLWMMHIRSARAK